MPPRPSGTGPIRRAAELGIVATGFALAGCPSPAAPPRGAAGAVPAASEPDATEAPAAPAPVPEARPAPAAVPVASPKPIRSTPADPVSERPAGDFTHPGTGHVFPAALAGFRRVSVRRYDAEGNDDGVGYSRVWKTFA